MATRKTKKAKSSKPAKKKTSRRSAAKAPAAAADVEEVETAGLGLDDGISLTTTVLLVGAVILAVVALGHYPAPAA